MFILLLTLLVSNSDCFAIALLCLRDVREMVSPEYFLIVSGMFSISENICSNRLHSLIVPFRFS